MNQQKFISSTGVSVGYMFQKGRYDYSSSLLVVFSGFLGMKAGGYDFVNPLQNYVGSVLFIEDNFDNKYSYYLCSAMDFSIERSVLELINDKIFELGCDKSNVVFTGFSKGGSAAIYYGLKYNFPNIIVSVPQFRIADHLVKEWKDTAAIDIMGIDYGVYEMDILNSILLKLMIQDENRDKNIYLLTSYKDQQFEFQIRPYIHYLKMYNNFNLIISHSVFVQNHNQVTAHHVQLLLGLYYLLVSELKPKLSPESHFWGSRPEIERKPKLEPLLQLESLRIIDGKLFIAGVGIIKGLSAYRYEDVHYTLEFASNENETELKILDLAKEHNNNLTRMFFENNYVNYDKCYFTTPGKKGLLLDFLGNGCYKLYLHIKIKDNTCRIPIIAPSKIIESGLSKEIVCGARLFFNQEAEVMIDINR